MKLLEVSVLFVSLLNFASSASPNSGFRDGDVTSENQLNSQRVDGYSK